MRVEGLFHLAHISESDLEISLICEKNVQNWLIRHGMTQARLLALVIRISYVDGVTNGKVISRISQSIILILRELQTSKSQRTAAVLSEFACYKCYCTYICLYYIVPVLRVQFTACHAWPSLYS